MSSQVRLSNCSSQLPVDLYWHARPDEGSLSRHVDLVTDELMDVVKAPAERRWNPYTETMVRREFRHRLMAATRGELVPVDHVKTIEHPLAAEMFEIRWQHVQITEQEADGRVRHRAAKVRLLHAEPDALGVVAIGLHAHEKLVVPDDARATRRAQDAEIEIAIGTYAAALPIWMGRSPAQPLHRDDGEGIG